MTASSVAPAGDASTRWAIAATLAAVFAVDPASIGGIVLHAPAGAARERWLALWRGLLPAGMPVRRVPLHIADGRLLGGLDLAATLQAGRPIAETGVIAATHGGVLVLAMAERLSAGTAARIARVLDTGELALEREGFAQRMPAHVGIVALDEGLADGEAPPTVLTERLALRLDLSALRDDVATDAWHNADDVSAARALLPQVRADGDIVEALCAAALALGVASLRAPSLALQVARVCAALDGRVQVNVDDATFAAQQVLAPRATQIPAPPPADPTNDDDTAPPDDGKDESRADNSPSPVQADNAQGAGAASNQDELSASPPPPPPAAASSMNDSVTAAAAVVLPAGLLARLAAQAGSGAQRSSGRAGSWQAGGLRGRPAGVQRGEPRGGARLNLLETLRAAAPWQRVRQAAGNVTTTREFATPRTSTRIAVRAEDFRVTRHRERRETTTIFVVDASGSAALARLAEAKGAVERLLADCYVRRDRVSVIAFRGRGVDVVLPPTRSLVRAKRGLAAMVGGGGTPLAGAIDAAASVAAAVTRRGGTPTVVFLTDGRANIARDGSPGRPRAEADARAACRGLAAAQLQVLLIDTSPRGEPQAAAWADAMRARYLALPYADASNLARSIRAATSA